MPEEINQQKAAKYKNRFVSKYLQKYPIKEVEQLPDDLKRLWFQGKYEKFLENALEELEQLKILQKVCETLGLSDEQEVREYLQDIDNTLKEFKKDFRFRHKGICKEQVSRAVKQLLIDLKKLLNNGIELKKILKKALGEFSRRQLKLSKCLWAMCPTLGLSHERKVHCLVQRFYYYHYYQEIAEVKGSWYAYITNRDNLKKSHKVRISEAKLKARARLKEKLRVTDNHCACDVEKLIFKVESEFIKKCQETPELQDGSLLLKAAKEFLSRIEIWLKLDGQFRIRRLPGVYFLFYIGEKELYPGSFIIGSKSVPVYVGMSASDIWTRLRGHRDKIRTAKDLDVADFAVKVMFVDNRHYAPCIEGMFIEHFVPVWNRETLGISFGSQSINSLWIKYHVDKDPDVRRDMMRKLLSFYY